MYTRTYACSWSSMRRQKALTMKRVEGEGGKESLPVFRPKDIWVYKVFCYCFCYCYCSYFFLLFVRPLFNGDTCFTCLFPLHLSDCPKSEVKEREEEEAASRFLDAFFSRATKRRRLAERRKKAKTASVYNIAQSDCIFHAASQQQKIKA